MNSRQPPAVVVGIFLKYLTKRKTRTHFKSFFAHIQPLFLLKTMEIHLTQKQCSDYRKTGFNWFPWAITFELAAKQYAGTQSLHRCLTTDTVKYSTHTHTHSLSNELNNGITNYREFTSVSLSGDLCRLCDLRFGVRLHEQGHRGNVLRVSIRFPPELGGRVPFLSRLS